MRASIEAKLSQISARWEELNRLLAHESIVGDKESFRRLSQEHSAISEIVQLYRSYKRFESDLTVAEMMSRDPDLRAYAESEIPEIKLELARLEGQLRTQLLPKDPQDDRDVFLEIRAGTGGDESAIFAGDLFRMYARFSERQGWKIELVSQSPSELGGFKEIVAKISGSRVYSRLKYESGVHRVQRVPATETQGRIHTSACTVAVLAEADEVSEVSINSGDIRVDTFRASGAGGQHVNKTDSAIRVTHLPTGIVVECQDDRSQHRNRAQALAILAARIRDQQLRKVEAETASQRKALVGTGDRSERIRTYNYAQGRVTDHRINLTLYKLNQVIDGDLEELISALSAEQQAMLLAALSEE